MSEYFQNDIKVCINFDAYNEQLLEHFGEEMSVLSPYYNARLINNNIKPRHIQLTIFYEQKYFLFEKIIFLHDKGIDILQFITSRPSQRAWDFPDILDFSNSKLINIESSPFWEHEKKPLIITLDNLDLLYQNKHIGDGRFQLTENALLVLDEYISYSYLANHDDDDKFILTNKNRDIRFGDINFILSFNHGYGTFTKYKLEIGRDAYLTISDDSKTLTDTELLNRADLICTLMSFYWQHTIDFFIAHIRINNIDNYHTRIKYKYSNHYVDETLDCLLKSSYESVYDFIESLDYEKVKVCRTLIEEITTRIIKSKIVDEISEFMLLYNIIEKIRNFCMENPIGINRLEIKEEFTFTLSGKPLYNYINTKIKEIVEIISPEDKEEFLTKANNKVNFIKKNELKDQFDSLVKFLGIDEQIYELNFTSLVRIRNKIYHGNNVGEEIKPYNDKMRLLINDLTLKLLQ